MSAPPPLDRLALVEVRAALAGGAAPAAALLAAADRAEGVLADADEPGAEGSVTAPATSTALRDVAAPLRVGRPLAAVAGEHATGDPATDLLVRALAIAERAGAGGVAAVDQALAAAGDAAAVDRLLSSRTAQARGTALLLTVLPLVAALLLVVTSPETLGFYRRPIGAGAAGVALLLASAGYWWSRRIVDGVRRAAAEADPLTPTRPRPRVARATTVAAPAAVVVTAIAGVGAGLAMGAALGAVALRPPQRQAPPSDGGASETIELLAVGLAAGLTPAAAVDVVAPLAPRAARPLLASAARRLTAGWPVERALDAGLAAGGAVIAASARWGAPAGPALRLLAAELRADRRAAAEEAAERAQLALVFPTTLLTLPAFVLVVVPPLVWTAFGG